MIVVLMGVSGCGKTTVGRQLACTLGWRFVEGDDLHSEASRAKMAAGIALEDADRWPWLDALGALLASLDRDGVSAVATCSALKRRYRDRLRRHCPGLRLVHLVGSEASISARLTRREGHYMPATLLPSQLATLEAPDADESVLGIDAGNPVAVIVAELVAALTKA